MKSLTKGAFAVVSVLVVGQLYAQPAPPTTDPTPTTLQLSAAEMQLRATELKTQLQVDLQHVLHLQTMARKEKDVIKLNCVNDKLVKLKAEANLFDMDHKELILALEKDATNAQPTYDLVVKAGDSVHKLREEADSCAGEPELTSGENTFTQPHFPDDPTKGLPFETGSLIEPPAYASPWT